MPLGEEPGKALWLEEPEPEDLLACGLSRATRVGRISQTGSAHGPLIEGKPHDSGA